MLMTALIVRRIAASKTLIALGVLTSLGFSLPLASADLDPLGNQVAGVAAETSTTPINELFRDAEDFGSCAVMLDFDELTGGDIFCNDDIITDQYAGLVFDVPDGDCVVCANSPPNLPDSSPPNVAFVTTPLHCACKPAWPPILCS